MRFVTIFNLITNQVEKNDHSDYDVGTLSTFNFLCIFNSITLAYIKAIIVTVFHRCYNLMANIKNILLFETE